MLENVLGGDGVQKWLARFFKQNETESIDYEYFVKLESQGPASNISVTRKQAAVENNGCCTRQKDGKEDEEEGQKILDVDFTFSLFCPKFPRDGKCKVASLIIS